MFSVAEKRELSATIERFAGEVEPGVLSMADASAWLADVVRMRAQLASVELGLSARVAEGREWARDGDRSPAHFLARTAGVSLGEASSKLDAARQMQELPVASEALAQGRVSETQFRHIADAAKAAPGAERQLVETAQRDTVTGLRRECARTKAAGLNAQQLHDRVHAARRLRHRRDEDGAFVLELRTTADAGAEVLAAVAHYQQDVFTAARQAGRREPFEAYAADALVAMARAAMSGGETGKAPKGGSDAKIIVRIDHTALVRGHGEAGELCEITGIGPIPVSVVDQFLRDGAFLAAVVTKGVDIASVAHLGRGFTAHQRTAPILRAIDGPARNGWRRGGEPPSAAKRARRRAPVTGPVKPGSNRRPHHDLKTFKGWRLEPGTGKRRLLPPDQQPATGETNPPALFDTG